MATGKPSGAALSRENCRMRHPGACIHNDGRCHISSPARQGVLQRPLKGKGAGGAAQGGGKQSEDGANANGNEEVEKEEDDDDEEEEKRTAPLELMAEFLGAIMGADYKLARKLCEMILIFEPHNAEAKQYLPVIEARITQEVEASQHEDSSDEDDDEESDDDDDDDLDDDDDDDDSEEDEDEPFRRNALCLNLQQISIK
ncbi:glutamate-rich protein 2 [Lethenteron reissneri]|uniref:glutamate-rich protein 2 n=1 Tax=Lethenteron reissneri TaxID=7753 RepID=UPI002AB6D057|nr:glutamate-rich protein 2 [Lethenteron reissneri]